MDSSNKEHVVELSISVYRILLQAKQYCIIETIVLLFSISIYSFVYYHKRGEFLPQNLSIKLNNPHNKQLIKKMANSVRYKMLSYLQWRAVVRIQ